MADKEVKWSVEGVHGGRPEWMGIMDHASTIILTCNTITLMMGMGAATYWREMWYHLKRPWSCIIGLGCQFIILPALGLGLCICLQLPPYQSLGVLILTCSPGGAFSNFFTYWADGDLALSIMMTAISSMVAFGAMPLNLWLYTQPWTDQELRVPYMNVLLSLAFVTTPAVVGMVVRHYNRKWANYISKVCGLLGWMGAITCGVMLILIYWDIIINTSVFLAIAAAVVPFAGFIIAYSIAKVVCFNHKVCRTVAIETSCQNIVVATNVMLLSFPSPEIRGQLVIFPVLYGLCQLAQMLTGIAIFQVWVFMHRHDVTEEAITSVVDNTVLTSIPVPAHKISQVRDPYKTSSDLCRRKQQDQKPPMQYEYNKNSCNGYHDEDIAFLEPESMADSGMWTTTHDVLNSKMSSPAHCQSSSNYKNTNKSSWTIPSWYSPRNLYQDSLPSPQIFTFSPEPSTKPRFQNYQNFLDEEVFSEDTDLPNSPTLSNKGVPNMFPVIETDFLAERRVESEESQTIYKHSNLSCRNTVQKVHTLEKTSEDLVTSKSRNSPKSPRSLSSPSLSRTFAFYHGDVQIGQTQQFSTFGRKT
ncbi:solute carrier family 10 member 6-like isoform X2 [Penaeus chinensis]|nr:solute carrier family 10 member 6-like isoform X2 [Penaeus chinensis]